MMKKIIVLTTVLILTLGVFAFAQDTGNPDAAQIGISSAQQKLKEVSVSKMEDAGLWYGVMAADEESFRSDVSKALPSTRNPSKVRWNPESKSPTTTFWVPRPPSTEGEPRLSL